MSSRQNSLYRTKVVFSFKRAVSPFCYNSFVKYQDTCDCDRMELLFRERNARDYRKQAQSRVNAVRPRSIRSKVYMKRSNVCPSVCPIDRQQQHAAGL